MGRPSRRLSARVRGSRAAEGLIVALKPGNAGGAKGPQSEWFRTQGNRRQDKDWLSQSASNPGAGNSLGEEHNGKAKAECCMLCAVLL